MATPLTEIRNLEEEPVQWEREFSLRHSECETPVGSPSEDLELNGSAAQKGGPD